MEDYIYGIIGFVIVTLLLTLWNKKKTNESWEGTVINIESKTENKDSEGSDWRTYFYVYYRTKEGKTGKYRFEEYQYKEVFPVLEVGDRLIKKSGNYYPNKG